MSSTIQSLTGRVFRTIWCVLLMAGLLEPAYAIGSSDRQSQPSSVTDLRQKQQILVDQAKKILANKDLQVPSPPSISVECNDEVANAQNSELVQSFAKKAASPEEDLLKRLLDVRRQLQTLGVDSSDSYALELQLVGRLKKKAELLFQQYGRQLDRRDKLAAIAAFTNHTLKVFELLGDAASGEALMRQFSTWIANLIPLMVSRLKDKHDYRELKAIFIVTRMATLAGADPGADKIYQQVAEAMQFDLSLAFTLKVTGANGYVDARTLNCEFPVHYEVDGAEKEVAKPVLAGSGTGKYVSYFESDPSPLTMTAPPFVVNVRIDDFDPCTGKAMVYIDRFYADNDKYTHKDSSWELPATKYGWQVLFKDRFKKGLYAFEAPFTNMSATPIDTEIPKTMNAYSATLRIKLVHKPR